MLSINAAFMFRGNSHPIDREQKAKGKSPLTENPPTEPPDNVTVLKTAQKPSTVTVGTTADRLKTFVKRIERLEEDKKGIADDIKDVYGEAKSEGFCTKTLRKVIALRKKDPAQRAEEEELLELYVNAIDGTGSVAKPGRGNSR